MNWKIITGGILIFAGSAQLLRLNEYGQENSLSWSFGLGFVFIAVVILGLYLERQG